MALNSHGIITARHDELNPLLIALKDYNTLRSFKK